jgi:hypothetical protein
MENYKMRRRRDITRTESLYRKYQALNLTSQNYTNICLQDISMTLALIYDKLDKENTE